MTAAELKALYPETKWFVDDDVLQASLDFAEKKGLLENFLESARYMCMPTFFGQPCESRVRKDFAPYSFDWSKWIAGKCIYNGGMIFHGRGDTGVDAPTFSVTMNPEEGWQIHT